MHVFKSLAEDVTAFLGNEGTVEFRRLAVTPEQIERLSLPTAPAKATDRRSFEGVGGDRVSTVQAEAIPPDELLRIVEQAINAEIDWDIFEHTKAKQEDDMAALRRRLRQSWR